MQLDDFADLFDLDLSEEKEGVDTVAGLLANRLGVVPIPGSSIDVQGINWWRRWRRDDETASVPSSSRSSPARKVSSPHWTQARVNQPTRNTTRRESNREQ